MKNKNGFTIIELLMVIAVAALILALVLIAVSQVRIKGNNSRIKGDMDQLRKQAEAIYAENGMEGYCVAGKSCFDATTQVDLVADIDARNGAGGATDIQTGASTYCVSSYLFGGETMCFDNTGKQSGTSYGAGAGTGLCSDGSEVACL